MGDLNIDSALAPQGDGALEGRLSRDWELWGPNGGYMAAFVLQAARIASGRSRPANASVHYLGVGSFDEPIRVTTEVLRAARFATSVSVRIHQGDRPLVAAMVWAIDDGVDGLEHDDAPAPDAPSWAELPTLAERLGADGVEPQTTYPFWANLDQRPTDWISDWPNRTLEPAVYTNWIRFVEGGPGADPWAQAARLLLLVDLGAWPAVGRRQRTEEWVAPSIDVSCEFHRPGTGDEWFLLRGESPLAADGLVASHQQVWNDSGQLLASGVSHLLCRRLPPQSG